MSLAEDGVIDFFTGTIEDGHIVICVLGTTMTLDGIIDRTEDVQLGQEIGTDHIVSIENNYLVKVAFDQVDGILHGFCLGTLFKYWLQ